MLEILGAKFGGAIVDALLGKVFGLIEAYMTKQVSMEELRAGMVKALIESMAEVEKANSVAVAQTFNSFMGAMVQSRLMKIVWAVVVLTQLFVLLWHQIGIPMWVRLFGGVYPSAGTTLEWAYLLIAFCLGAGPLILKTGPGATKVSDLTAAIDKK